MVNTLTNLKQEKPLSFSITREEQQALYDRRFKSLMEISKEDLIKIILGERP